MRKERVIVKYEDHFNTCNIKRKFPEWAKVDRVINGLEIYNMNIFYLSGWKPNIFFVAFAPQNDKLIVILPFMTLFRQNNFQPLR